MMAPGLACPLAATNSNTRADLLAVAACAATILSYLIAACAGTFIYVAFMEVLPRELSCADHRLTKLGMLILGFGLMSLLAIWA